MSAAPAQASAAMLTQGLIPRQVLNMALVSMGAARLALLRREFSRKLG